MTNKAAKTHGIRRITYKISQPGFNAWRNGRLENELTVLARESATLIHRCCGFDSQSGHSQEATKESIKKWNNK